MKVHNIRVETFYHEDDFEIVQQGLVSILPADVVVERDVIEPELEGGVFKEPLIVLRAKIEKSKDIEEFLRKLRENLSEEDIDTLRNEVQNRIDNGCNFHIRLGKEELLNGRFVLQYSDAVHIKIKLAVYPAKKENAVRYVEGWLG